MTIFKKKMEKTPAFVSPFVTVSSSPKQKRKEKARNQIQMLPSPTSSSTTLEEVRIDVEVSQEEKEKEQEQATKQQSKRKKEKKKKSPQERMEEEIQQPEFMSLTPEETLFAFLYGALCMLFAVLTYKFSLEYVWLYWMYPLTYVWSGVAGNMFVHIGLYNWAPREFLATLMQIHDFRLEEKSSLNVRQKTQVTVFGLMFLGLAIGNMYLTEGVNAVHWMYPLTFFYAGVAGNILIALFFVPVFSKKYIKVLQKVHDIH